jgi:hypothetical protein
MDGVTVYDILVIKKYVYDFYRSLLGQSSDKCISLSTTVWSLEDCLTEQQQHNFTIHLL